MNKDDLNKTELELSVKSKLGSPSTLMNADRNTNFIYKIDNTNLSDNQIIEINSINPRKFRYKQRIEKIKEFSGKINFTTTENLTFKNNLTFIDSSLPRIMAEIIYLFYTTKLTKIADLVNELSRTNPLNYNLADGHPFYAYKIKRFLTDIALGMTPAKVWTGVLDATGGNLIVKESGEILCYHIYNRNEFENYLYYNTKLDTPRSDFDYGKVYKEGSDFFFKLNLQIRYLK